MDSITICILLGTSGVHMYSMQPQFGAHVYGPVALRLAPSHLAPWCGSVAASPLHVPFVGPP